MNNILFENEEIIPSKLVCVGRNYVEHIAELNNEIPTKMVVFNKPNSAISNTLQHFIDEPLHYEAELCFIIKQGQLQGVGLGLDLTKRALQSELKAKGLPWERAKAFNGSCLLTNFISLDKITSLEELSFTLSINGKVSQQAKVEQMINKPQAILNDVQSFMQLDDSDVLMTGTPKGVGTFNTGDVFELSLYCQEACLLQESFKAV